jgi:uncharacterized protein YecT (DUF1311 family)
LPVKASPHSVATFPCPRNSGTTVAIEACEARRLLKLDRRFNAVSAALWSVLDQRGRRSFVRAHGAWLAYRANVCATQARAFAGGTAAPVVYGRCELDLTAARIREVRATLALYCQGKARTGRFRRCPRS